MGSSREAEPRRRSLAAWTSELNELTQWVEHLHEQLDELKLERKTNVRSMFHHFDADKLNSLSMSELKRMDHGLVRYGHGERREGGAVGVGNYKLGHHARALILCCE